MTDYRCDHGYYAMGRDCPTCQKERDEARADHRRSMHAAIEQRERLAQATALLREWREDDGLPSATHTSKRGRTDDFLAGQPAPVKRHPVHDSPRLRAAMEDDTPVVDDAMVEKLRYALLGSGVVATRSVVRAALVAALEGRK